MNAVTKDQLANIKSMSFNGFDFGPMGIRLTVNEKLWSTYDKNKPWEHRLNKSLPGLQEAVQMMPVGSKWMVYIPSSLAPGNEVMENVPAGAALIYELEVLKSEK